MSKNDPAEGTVWDIRRKTRKQYTAEEKIRIVVSGLRGEESIAALCRREGIAEGLYYSWSKEFLEAGKKRLAGDTGRQATSGEVKGLRQEMRDLKELVAELSLENRLLKKRDLYTKVTSRQSRSLLASVFVHAQVFVDEHINLLRDLRKDKSNFTIVRTCAH